MASIPQGSQDSSIAGGSEWTDMETMLKNKLVVALANSMIMVGLRTFQPYLEDRHQSFK